MHTRVLYGNQDKTLCFLLCVFLFFQISNTQIPDRVSQIPVQFPLTGPDNERKYIPEFSVVFTGITKISDIEAKGPMYKDWKMCGVVLYPFRVTLEFNFRGYNTKFGRGETFFMSFPPDVRQVDLTFSQSQDAKRIALCNPLLNKKCEVCVKKDNIFRAKVFVIRNDASVGAAGNEYTTKQTLMENSCLFMESMDCGPKTCNNGEYSTEYLRLDSLGAVISKNRCLPCPPGTWLTCINDFLCTYDIPSAPGAYEPGDDMHSMDYQTPVGSCFTCESAGKKVHYGKTGSKQIIDAYVKSPLPWICPGSARAPIMCPSQFVGADSNFSSCVCKPGEYQVGETICQACPTGSKCPNGAREECPDDFYQNQVSQIECWPCLSPTGTPFGCPFNTSMRKCTGQYKKEEPFCVTCNMCARDYVSHPAGRVDCY
jgi:hypothetical protein